MTERPIFLSTEKKETIKLTGIMSFSGIVGKIFSIPNAIITAKFLGPSLYGVLAIINLIIQYTGLSSLGILQGLSRDVPIAYGKGNRAEADGLKNTVYSSFSVLSAAALVILWMLYIFGVTFKGVLSLFTLTFVSLIFVTNRIKTFLESYIKAEGQFMIIGKQELIIKSLTPVLNIPAVIFFKLKGVLAAMLLMGIVSITFYFIRLKKPKFQFSLSINKSLQILKTGFVIFVSKLSESIFWSIDMIILTAMTVTSSVGLYSFALKAIGLGETFTRGINMTVFRKMMVDGGKHGVTSKEHFKKYTEHHFVLYLMFHSLILGGGILIYSLIIRTLLPKYFESLPVIIILGFGYLIYSSRGFMNAYLNVTNQLFKWLFIILCGLGINVALDIFLILKGYGIQGVAFACSFSFIFIAFLIIGISFSQIYGSIKTALCILFKILAIAVILMGIIFVFSKWDIFDFTSILSSTGQILWGFADLIIKGLIFSLVCFSIFFLSFPKYRLHKEIKPIFQYIREMLVGWIKPAKNE